MFTDDDKKCDEFAQKLNKQRKKEEKTLPKDASSFDSSQPRKAKQKWESKVKSALGRRPRETDADDNAQTKAGKKVNMHLQFQVMRHAM